VSRRPDGGLCETCVHQRLVRTTRGSEFSLCDRSRTQPEYARYPPLPVTRCPGHEPRAPGSQAPPATGSTR
jgi:hypothetical protein